MQGRNPMPVNPKELDTLRFGLVPGGYFEAEVDAALKDVQDTLSAADPRTAKARSPVGGGPSCVSPPARADRFDAG